MSCLQRAQAGAWHSMPKSLTTSMHAQWLGHCRASCHLWFCPLHSLHIGYASQIRSLCRLFQCLRSGGRSQ
eukprot:354266-Chlamydomonas_euryale.AAC.5